MEKEMMDAVFPFMKGIRYNGPECAEVVENRRKSIYHSEKKILSDNQIKYTFQSWNELPNGRFTVNYDQFRFDCLFHRKEGPLIVILNGALLGKRPEFKRWSYYNFLPGSMLNIADPMYFRYEDLKLGWYYGDEENNLREYLSKIIMQAAKMLGLSNNEIIIIGSSGGGAAAIHTGALIKGSTVIAINAQIKLSLYYYHKIFTQITGVDLCGKDKYGRNDTAHFLTDNEKYPTNFIFLSNIKSKVDCEQIDYFLKIKPLKLKYGITQENNLTYWLYDAVSKGKGGPHGAQEYRQILFVILFLAKCVSAHVSLEEYEALYLLWGEFWNKHFEMLDVNQEFCTQMKRKIELINLNLSYESIKDCRLITAISDRKVSAGTEAFKSIIVSNEMEGNKIYCLHLGRIEGRGSELFTILIRDMRESQIYCRQDIMFGSDIMYWFKTAEDAKEMELRLYCGRPAHTKDVEIDIEELSLLCISD
ncbi:MAG: hypothetical protein IJZ44_02765 [Lachnospiraceae bacterium]|nr:hypothetical protein [Lachnospiraceae bacterium]MBQ8230887.1 hypothetical protein [Lachnospiraceae bacterium]